MVIHMNLNIHLISIVHTKPYHIIPSLVLFSACAPLYSIQSSVERTEMEPAESIVQ
jgi:hypothetical protein